MQEMELVGVRVEMPANVPVLLLRELAEPSRTVPIFIGAPEATAIALALDEIHTPRPMTHDLIREIFDEFGVDVEKVVVTDLSEKTFFAELHLMSDGVRHAVSSRPSDAIAIAARTGAPIFMADPIIDEVGYSADEVDMADEEEAEEVVEQFKEFIDSITPEDFDA